MGIELDHVFVCAGPGGAEAEQLIQFGLREGPPNRHPRQGTANRRFFFTNAMLELLFVSDAAEAQSEHTARTRLFERWSGRHGGASPFGICVRPAGPSATEPPFPAWAYRPAYLPGSHVMHIAETGLDEPMWVYMGFARRVDYEQRFIEHPIGAREITALALTSPVPLRSAAAQTVMGGNILSTRQGSEHLLEVEFDRHQQGQAADFRPHLPLVFRL